jgi:hypothetical protein
MTSGKGLQPAEHWRRRAEEARTRASGFHDTEAKQTMLRIAEMYDRMAAHADLREASSRADVGRQR